MTRITELATPVVLINEEQLNRNIKSMQNFANKNNYKLRPHIKTHKSVTIANRQIGMGASGITVATVEEAYAMADNGIRDILLASPIVTMDKISMALNLIPKVVLTLVVDSIKGVEAIAEISETLRIKVPILVKVNTGLNRFGVVSTDEIIAILSHMQKFKSLQAIGLITHAGHSYRTNSEIELQRVGVEEKKIISKHLSELKENGYYLKEGSVGSTPTAKIGGDFPEITELRPGNYVFNDYNQIRLGVAKIDQCSLSVLSTVVSNPSKNRYIVDAGSKTLSSDLGASNKDDPSTGYGLIKGKDGFVITRLSEESAVIEGTGEEKLEIGEKIEIIPNHACPVMNLCEQVYFYINGVVTEIVSVDARGMVK